MSRGVLLGEKSRKAGTQYAQEQEVQRESWNRLVPLMAHSTMAATSLSYRSCNAPCCGRPADVYCRTCTQMYCLLHDRDVHISPPAPLMQLHARCTDYSVCAEHITAGGRIRTWERGASRSLNPGQYLQVTPHGITMVDSAIPLPLHIASLRARACRFCGRTGRLSQLQASSLVDSNLLQKGKKLLYSVVSLEGGTLSGLACPQVVCSSCSTRQLLSHEEVCLINAEMYQPLAPCAAVHCFMFDRALVDLSNALRGQNPGHSANNLMEALNVVKTTKMGQVSGLKRGGGWDGVEQQERKRWGAEGRRQEEELPFKLVVFSYELLRLLLLALLLSSSSPLLLLPPPPPPSPLPPPAEKDRCRRWQGEWCLCRCRLTGPDGSWHQRPAQARLLGLQHLWYRASDGGRDPCCAGHSWQHIQFLQPRFSSPLPYAQTWVVK